MNEDFFFFLPFLEF